MSPDDRTGRADSRAVLIGVENYHDPAWPTVPGAGGSLRGMHQMLTDPELGGWPYSRVTVIGDPVDSRHLALQLRGIAQDTVGALLIYFVGHGTPSPHSGEPVLALTDTQADGPDVTGLAFAAVRSAVLASPAKVKAVILDCCFSGRAIPVMAGEDGQFADVTEVTGSYTLTSADRLARSDGPGGATAFTGELLNLVRTGIDSGPDPLTFADLYPRLRQRLAASNLPVPNQRGTDTAASFPFTRNARQPPNAAIAASATDDEAPSKSPRTAEGGSQPGIYEQARDLGADTLDRRRRVLGPDHPNTLKTAHGLAWSLGELGEHAKARDLNTDTLDRYRRVLGPDHPDTLKTAQNLAWNLRNLK